MNRINNSNMLGVRFVTKDQSASSSQKTQPQTIKHQFIPILPKPSQKVEFNSNLSYADKNTSSLNTFHEEHCYSRNICDMIIINTNSRPGPSLERPINLFTHGLDNAEFQEQKNDWLYKYSTFISRPCVHNNNHICHEDDKLLKIGDLFENAETIRTYIDKHAMKWLHYYPLSKSNLQRSHELYTYRCVYSSNNPNLAYKSKKMRKRTESFKTKCPAVIHISRMKDTKYLVVVKMCNHHDHPLTEESFLKLQHGRRLDPQIKEEISDLLFFKVKPTILQRYVQEKTGYIMNLKWFFNIISNIKKKSLEKKFSYDELQVMNKKIEYFKLKYDDHQGDVAEEFKRKEAIAKLEKSLGISQTATTGQPGDLEEHGQQRKNKKNKKVSLSEELVVSEIDSEATLSNSEEDSRLERRLKQLAYEEETLESVRMLQESVRTEKNPWTDECYDIQSHSRTTFIPDNTTDIIPSRNENNQMYSTDMSCNYEIDGHQAEDSNFNVDNIHATDNMEFTQENSVCEQNVLNINDKPLNYIQTTLNGKAGYIVQGVTNNGSIIDLFIESEHAQISDHNNSEWNGMELLQSEEIVETGNNSIETFDIHKEFHNGEINNEIEITDSTEQENIILNNENNINIFEGRNTIENVNINEKQDIKEPLYVNKHSISRKSTTEQENVHIDEHNVIEESDNKIGKQEKIKILNIVDVHYKINKPNLIEKQNTIIASNKILQQSTNSKESTNPEQTAFEGQTSIKEQSTVTEQIKIAKQNRFVEQNKITEQVRIANQNRIAEQTIISEQAKIAEHNRIAEQTTIQEQDLIELEDIIEPQKEKEISDNVLEEQVISEDLQNETNRNETVHKIVITEICDDLEDSSHMSDGKAIYTVYDPIEKSNIDHYMIKIDFLRYLQYLSDKIKITINEMLINIREGRARLQFSSTKTDCFRTFNIRYILYNRIQVHENPSMSSSSSLTRNVQCNKNDKHNIDSLDSLENNELVFMDMKLKCQLIKSKNKELLNENKYIKEASAALKKSYNESLRLCRTLEESNTALKNILKKCQRLVKDTDDAKNKDTHLDNSLSNLMISLQKILALSNVQDEPDISYEDKLSNIRKELLEYQEKSKSDFLNLKLKHEVLISTTSALKNFKRDLTLSVNQLQVQLTKCTGEKQKLEKEINDLISKYNALFFDYEYYKNKSESLDKQLQQLQQSTKFLELENDKLKLLNENILLKHKCAMFDMNKETSQVVVEKTLERENNLLENQNIEAPKKSQMTIDAPIMYEMPIYTKKKQVATTHLCSNENSDEKLKITSMNINISSKQKNDKEISQGVDEKTIETENNLVVKQNNEISKSLCKQVDTPIKHKLSTHTNNMKVAIPRLCSKKSSDNELGVTSDNEISLSKQKCMNKETPPSIADETSETENNFIEKQKNEGLNRSCMVNISIMQKIPTCTNNMKVVIPQSSSKKNSDKKIEIITVNENLFLQQKCPTISNVANEETSQDIEGITDKKEIILDETPNNDSMKYPYKTIDVSETNSKNPSLTIPAPKSYKLRTYIKKRKVFSPSSSFGNDIEGKNDKKEIILDETPNNKAMKYPQLTVDAPKTNSKNLSLTVTTPKTYNLRTYIKKRKLLSPSCSYKNNNEKMIKKINKRKDVMLNMNKETSPDIIEDTEETENYSYEKQNKASKRRRMTDVAIPIYTDTNAPFQPQCSKNNTNMKLKVRSVPRINAMHCDEAGLISDVNKINEQDINHFVTQNPTAEVYENKNQNDFTESYNKIKADLLSDIYKIL